MGELDLATAEPLHEAVQELLDAGFRQLTIDLRALSFMDLTGLRLLLTLAADAGRDGWRLTVVPGRPSIRRLFELTNTLDALPLASPTTMSAAIRGHGARLRHLLERG